MDTIKIIIYEQMQEGTSFDIKQQQELKKQGNRPVGIVKASFDEAIGESIYYTVESVVFFDTVRLTVIDKYMRFNYCIYRINEDHKLIYDHVASTKGVLEEGKITDIRYSNEKEELEYIFFNGEEYKGRI